MQEATVPAAPPERNLERKEIQNAAFSESLLQRATVVLENLHLLQGFHSARCHSFCNRCTCCCAGTSAVVKQLTFEVSLGPPC